MQDLTRALFADNRNAAGDQIERIFEERLAALSAGVVEAWFKFETRVGRCTGQVRLKQGSAWTIFTALDELKGHEERLRERRPVGAEHGVYPGRLSWAERRSQNRDDLGFRKQPDVVILGGGQAGLARQGPFHGG